MYWSQTVAITCVRYFCVHTCFELLVTNSFSTFILLFRLIQNQWLVRLASWTYLVSIRKSDKHTPSFSLNPQLRLPSSLSRWVRNRMGNALEWKRYGCLSELDRMIFLSPSCYCICFHFVFPVCEFIHSLFARSLFIAYSTTVDKWWRDELGLCRRWKEQNEPSM